MQTFSFRALKMQVLRQTRCLFRIRTTLPIELVSTLNLRGLRNRHVCVSLHKFSQAEYF